MFKKIIIVLSVIIVFVLSYIVVILVYSIIFPNNFLGDQERCGLGNEQSQYCDSYRLRTSFVSWFLVAMSALLTTLIYKLLIKRGVKRYERKDT